MLYKTEASKTLGSYLRKFLKEGKNHKMALDMALELVNNKDSKIKKNTKTVSKKNNSRGR